MLEVTGLGGAEPIITAASLSLPNRRSTRPDPTGGLGARWRGQGRAAAAQPRPHAGAAGAGRGRRHPGGARRDPDRGPPRPAEGAQMKTLTLLVLPLAICFSSPSVAQQAGINAGPEAGAPASGDPFQNGADAEIAAQWTWQELLSRVGSAPAKSASAKANSAGALNVLVGEINAGTNIRLIE